MKFPPPPTLTPLDLSRAARQAPPAASQHDRLVGQAETWVAQTFFGTLLKQMQESPFKSDLFSGGRGGQAFSSLYHQQLTERMARGAGGKLVNSIVRRIEATSAYQKQQRTDSQAIPPAPAAMGASVARPRTSNNNGRRHVAAAPRA